MISSKSTKTAKCLFELAFHNASITKANKQELMTMNPPDENVLRWQYLRAQGVDEFIRYILTMQEPSNYLALITAIRQFRHKDDKTTFFDYYYRKYIQETPKLFIYGKRDIFLLGLPGFFGAILPNRQKHRDLEAFYASLGNQQVLRGEWSHMLLENPKQHLSSEAGTSNEVFAAVITFLQNEQLFNKKIAHYS